MKEHDKKQLDKVSIILPNIGKGGPGLKKLYLSDSELEKRYLSSDGSLECDKCRKSFKKSGRIGFRKHLHYHAHRQKKYVYHCSECEKSFNDPSNLKRHMHSLHEKQLFR